MFENETASIVLKMSKDNKKLRITTDDQWKSIVYDFLADKENKRGKTNFYELLRTKYELTKSTTLKMYDKYEKEFDLSANKGKDEAVLTESKKAIESGLKLKNDRLLELQNQYKKLEDELATNKTVVSTFHDGSLVTDYRELTPLEKAKLHQVIKELRAEISKIEGDYAPTKQDLNVKGITPQKIIFK